jgi:hypothetical protein
LSAEKIRQLFRLRAEGHRDCTGRAEGRKGTSQDAEAQRLGQTLTTGDVLRSLQHSLALARKVDRRAVWIPRVKRQCRRRRALERR